MPYADEFDAASAIEDMANTLDQASSGPMGWGQGPEGNEGIPIQQERDVGSTDFVPSEDAYGPVMDERAREQQMVHMLQDTEQPANITDQTMRNKSSLETSGPMNWGNGPEGSEGTIDLGQNPSLQALEAAITGGGSVDPLAGEVDVTQQTGNVTDYLNETLVDAAKAGADVNTFLEATRGSDIRRQEELGVSPNINQGTVSSGVQSVEWDGNFAGTPIGQQRMTAEQASAIAPTGGGQGWVNPNAKSYGYATEGISAEQAAATATGGGQGWVDPNDVFFGQARIPDTGFITDVSMAPQTQAQKELSELISLEEGQATPVRSEGDDTRGDNPIDIIRSTYAWAASLPNNVLFNAARYPDYLRLLIEYDAAGKDLPLTVPTWVLEGTDRPPEDDEEKTSSYQTQQELTWATPSWLT